MKSIEDYSFLMTYRKEGMTIDIYNSLSEVDKLQEIIALGKSCISEEQRNVLRIINDLNYIPRNNPIHDDISKCMKVINVQYIPHIVALYLFYLAYNNIKLRQILRIEEVENIKEFVGILDDLHDLCYDMQCAIIYPIEVAIPSSIEPRVIKCPHCGKLARKNWPHIYSCDNCHKTITLSYGKRIDETFDIINDINKNKYDHHEIIEKYQEIELLFPDDPTLLNRIGVKYSYINKEKSLEYYQKARNVDEHFYTVEKNIGNYYFTKDRMLLASSHYLNAISLLKYNAIGDSEKGYIYATYAYCLEGTKDYKKAFEMLTVASQYNGSETKKSIDLGVGMVYWKKELLNILHNAGISDEDIHTSLNEQDKKDMLLQDSDVPYVYFKPQKSKFSKLLSNNKYEVNGLVVGKKTIIFKNIDNIENSKYNIFNVSYHLFKDAMFKLDNDKLIIEGLYYNKKPITFKALVGKDGPTILKILEDIKETWSSGKELFIKQEE